MYMTSFEKMWGYLHDRKDCVDQYLFVTDPYTYTSRFVDMLIRNPEVISELKSKIRMEKRNSSIIGLFLRGGYGISELRIMRMMKYSDYLANEFMEFNNTNEEVKLLKK